MSPYEAAASLSTDQLNGLLELGDRQLRACLYNERAERLAAAHDLDDQLTDDDTALDIDTLLGDDR